MRLWFSGSMKVVSEGDYCIIIGSVQFFMSWKLTMSMEMTCLDFLLSSDNKNVRQLATLIYILIWFFFQNLQ